MTAPVSIEAARAARRSPPDPAAEIRQLQAEAGAKALALADAFIAQADALIAAAAMVASLGDALHPGIREAARNLGVEVESRTVSLKQIMARVK